MFEFAMPSLGADMETGTVLQWYVAPGDVVKRGQIVALVDTEKAEIEVEIWNAGSVDRILVEPGREVPVGTPILILREESAKVSAPEPQVAASPPSPPAARPAPRPLTPPLTPAPTPSVAMPAAKPTPDMSRGRDRIGATPLARRLAHALALDLRSMVGSGPHGRIRAQDVRARGERAAATSPVRASAPAVPASRSEQTLSPERLAAIRRGMAVAMARSKREIPHFYLDTDVDMTRALAWLETANRERSVEERLLLQVLLLKATARALVDVPELNGHWSEDRFIPAPRVHLGVAIAVRGGGLLAPALHDADRKGLDELMHDLADLVARARRAQLRSSEVQDATATVTSLGDRGPDRVFGVIYPPQVALVGFGAVRDRPWAEARMLGVRPIVNVTLSADHRASDGQRGARLLRRIALELSAPEGLA